MGGGEAGHVVAYDGHGVGAGEGVGRIGVEGLGDDLYRLVL